MPMKILEKEDNLVYRSIKKELIRQQNNIELIASENIVSKAVLEAMGSILTNKYAEGYPDARYYNGCKYIDEIESLAIERCKKLFKCNFANVQPHSGASANLAVLFALLNTGDTILGMSLDAGGHLTHGAKPTISGKWFNSVQYGLDENGILNYNELGKKLYENNPKLLIVGASAYSRTIDFKKIKDILDEYKKKTGNICYYMVDIAHIAGLVATGLHPSPFPHADVVTSTTHKTLRGPRGGIILANNEEIAQKIDKSIFPGCQGGPLEHIIAGKAVAFGEDLKPEFRTYCDQVIKNAKTLADELLHYGFKIVSNGTDNHMMLVDLTPFDATGSEVANWLDGIGITCNKNAIPNDPKPKTKTSGIRLGTPAVTTRGFKEEDMKEVARIIFECVQYFSSKERQKPSRILKLVEAVKELTLKYPIYE